MVKNLMRNLAFILFVFVSATACRDDIDAYYERPDWLRGTTLDVLTEMGDYSCFIEAVKNSDYFNLLDGRGLCTVFAPNDAAFSEWLQTNYQTDDVTVVPKDTLNLLVGCHILNYSYNEKELLGFSTMGDAVEESNGDGRSYHYESPARGGVVMWRNAHTMRKVLRFQEKKYIPIISTRLFKTKEIDAEKNYKFFFPEVNWQGNDEKLYLTNSAMIDVAVPTDNGYLYTIDKVASPLPTVYDALVENTEYALFNEMYDRFALLEYSPQYSAEYGAAGDSIFILWHGTKPQMMPELPELASEKSYHEEQGKDVMKTQSYAVTCFAPKDKVLKNYFMNFLAPYEFSDFSEIWDEKNPTTTQMYLLMKAHALDKRELILPEEIENGFMGDYGENYIIPMDKLAAEKHKFCSNGVFYGIDTIMEPYIFKAITRVPLRYPQYNVFRTIIDLNDSYKLLVDSKREYTMFIQNDSIMEEKSKWLIDWGVPDEYGDEHVLSANNGAEIGKGSLKDYFERHTFNTPIPDPGTVGDTLKFFRAMKQFYYMYIDNGSIYDPTGQGITQTITYNECDNGKVYETNEVFSTPGDDIPKKIFSNNPKFHLYMLNTGLAAVDQRNRVTYPWAKGQRLLAFVPSDEALQAAIDAGKLPAPEFACATSEDSLSVVKFLKSCFVPVEANNLGDYILPNFGFENKFNCMTSVDFKQNSDIVRRKITWVKGERVLHIEAETPNGTESLTTDPQVPIFARDGVLYKLNGCFTPDI